MKNMEWRTIDKSAWAKGPWRHEVDKKQWTDPKTGMACLIVRTPMGHLCGYVGVPEGHKLHGADYHMVDADVHGGLTFADHCHPGESEATGVCHLTEPGDPEVWWFGFDCAHSGDMSPGIEHRGLLLSCMRGTYRNQAYVGRRRP
ncbi:MAG: hypothetical protein FJ271_27330 [Planctomycetes bacterium]|nr:hypothetical protein [Planctomycetota bacterium]